MTTDKEVSALPEVPGPRKTYIDEVLSVANAAKRLGVHRSGLYKAIHSDPPRLKAFKASTIGDKHPETVIRISDLEEFASKSLRPNARRKKKEWQDGISATE